ncbi:MAG TPA: hypothetical protein VLA50_04620 [Erythrobacter sp.]|nr:hypothetical protein [Erythrobacter sp.]
MNQLLSAHQLAVVAEAEADSRAARATHGEDITALAVRIRSLRAGSGADVSGAPFIVGEPVADYFER